MPTLDRALHQHRYMMLSLDQRQSEVLREVLTSQLRQLRVESARADLIEVRYQLHARERIVEEILASLEGGEARSYAG
jgi:hypothetical protein